MELLECKYIILHWGGGEKERKDKEETYFWQVVVRKHTLVLLLHFPCPMIFLPLIFYDPHEAREAQNIDPYPSGIAFKQL